MNRIARNILIILLTVARLYSTTISDFEEFGCVKLVPMMQKEFYKDGYMVSQLRAYNTSMDKLTKYIRLLIDNLSEEFKKECSGFIGYLKEQIESCPDTQLPTSCDNIVGFKPGIHHLQRNRGGYVEPYYAYCLQDSEGGKPWTVIQRRESGWVSFNRSYADYEDGFGNIRESFWLGLKNIYALLNSTPHELWIQIEDIHYGTHHAKYDEFLLGGADRGYALLYLGDFKGTVGHSSGVQFAPHTGVRNPKCATDPNGVWWYPDCGMGNLNGIYPESTDEMKKGIIWQSWVTFNYEYAHMAIRPKGVST